MKSFPPLSAASLKEFQKLHQKRYRIERGQFLIEGARLVEEAMRADWTLLSVIVTSEFAGKHDDFLSAALDKKIRVFVAEPDKLTGLTDTVTPQGVVAVAELKRPDWMEIPAGRFLGVVLDSVADPGNVGTIIRTCDWFGVDEIHMGEGSVEITNPKVVRSTMGSIFHLPIFINRGLEEILSHCRRSGVCVVATVPEGGEDLRKVKLSQRLLIILGNEARGISEIPQHLVDKRVTIPKFGKAESLNVSATCAAILSHVRLGTRHV